MIVSRYTIWVRVDDKYGIYFLLNPLTGAIDIADEEPIKILEQIRSRHEYYGDLYYYLKERGYIFDNSEEETRLIEKLLLNHEEYFEREPMTFVIGVTLDCNYACKYCFQSMIRHKTKENGRNLWNKHKIQKLFEAIDKIIDLKSKQDITHRVTLFGGGPLLPSLYGTIKTIFDEIKERNLIPYEIITNGYYLLEYVPLLKEYNVQLIQVTIDGTKEIHNYLRPLRSREGTFEKIVKGIDAALKNGIEVHLRVNVNKLNLNNLPDLAKYIIEKGWGKNNKFKAFLGLTFPFGTPFKETLEEDEALREILKLYKKFDTMNVFNLGYWDIVERIISALSTGEPLTPKVTYCGANTTTYGFDPYGKIYAYFDAIGMNNCAIGEYYPTFNINRKLEKLWRRTVFDIPKCKECKYALLCGGGCCHHTILAGNPLDSPLCPDIEKSLSLTLKGYYKEHREELI